MMRAPSIKEQRHKYLFLALPALLWMAIFLVIPLGIVFAYSFFHKESYGGVGFDFTFDNYHRAFDWLYLSIYVRSVKMAAMTTFILLLISYPLAYVMATSRPKHRPIYLFLVMLPFLSNFVVRAYALRALLGFNGPTSQFLEMLGVIHEPISLNLSVGSVWFGLITNYLPFMVMPLYVALLRFDYTLLDAARDLGASAFTLIFRVLIPLTKEGIIAGCILVFMPVLGEFVIPDMLGGAKTMLMGNLITDQFLKARDWPFGAALSILVIALIFMAIALERFFKDSAEKPVIHG